tara:strand:- start:360 stop:626 length:267 start_codon:yes stop_codon:yes gene_type:complete
MQKLINGLAVFSGLVSITLVGATATIYVQRDSIIENTKTKVTEEITKSITATLPGIVGEMMPEVPELPTSTGGVAGESAGVGGVSLPF